MSRAKFYVI